MKTLSVFATAYEDLPKTIAIFPLQGSLLLPFTRLDLNIFEPRYLNMTIDALANHRLIGIIQPGEPGKGESIGDEDPVQDTGCAGRIVSFNETDDGRLVISLLGISRFRITQELELHNGYRSVVPDWQMFQHDFTPASTQGLNRELILTSVNNYLNSHSIEANLDSLESVDTEALVNMLSVHLPFDSAQKQTLLRSVSLTDRYNMLIALCELDSEQHDSPIVKH